MSIEELKSYRDFYNGLLWSREPSVLQACGAGTLDVFDNIIEEIEILKSIISDMTTRLQELEEVHYDEDGVLVWSSCGEPVGK